MTIQLRAHHLLCMLTYIGQGYSMEFIKNYDSIALRINNAEKVILIDGPDDICAAISSHSSWHCLNHGPKWRDQLALQELKPILPPAFFAREAQVLTTNLINKLRASYLNEALQNICTGCEWQHLCLKVAKTGFKSTHVIGSLLQTK